MQYQTRHMVAQRDIQRDSLVRSGETFECSEVDAGYYLDKGHARERQQEPAKATLPSQAVTPNTQARRPGRPSNAERAAAAAEAPNPAPSDVAPVAAGDQQAAPLAE